MKSKASIKSIKLPKAPEPTRAVYKKPVVGTWAPGMRVIEIPSVYNPRPAPIPKPRPKPKKPAGKKPKKDEKIERAVRAVRKRWWTEEKVMELIKLHKQGLTFQAIADTMRTSKGAVAAQVNRLVERGILEPRVERYVWTQNDLDALMNMRAEGKSFGEIGDRLGRNAKTCAEQYRRQNVKQSRMRNLFS